MAYGLFSLQFSRFSFALGGFCHFLPFNGFLCNFPSFPLLWAASAKNAEKVVLSRFPSDSEHVTNKSRWDMVYFPCKFHFFLCFGRLLPNCWKSRSFHPFNGFLCHFLVLTLRWGAPSGTTAEKVAISMLFPTAAKHHFYDFIALREPNPVSFVHCQGFLRNLSVSLHTNRWHMAYFLCNFQGFPLLWAASAISTLSMGFSAIF